MSDIVGACAIALFWLGLVRAVGPRVDRGERGDRDGRRGPRRLVTVVLLVATGLALAVAVAALVVGLGDGSRDHAAILVAGRLASSAAVLAVVATVWLADGMHDAPRGRADTATGTATGTD